MDDPRVRHDLTPNDPETLPPPVKAYEDGLPVTPLPRDLPAPRSAGDGGARRSRCRGRQRSTRRSWDACSSSARASCGHVSGRSPVHQGRKVLFRAAGSAGGRFPLEVYASTRGVAGVPDGVHWYDPVAHALVQVGPPAGGDATTLVVTGIPWRTGWRYAERGWRHLYWDGGTLLSQLQAAAASAGLAPQGADAVPGRAGGSSLVGADGVHEYPLVLLSLGDDTPAIEPAGEPHCGRPAARSSTPSAPRRNGPATATCSAGRGRTASRCTDVPESAGVDEVVLRRGSQRLMDPDADASRAPCWSGRCARRCAASACRTGSRCTGRRRRAGHLPLARPRRAGPGGDQRAELLRICLDQFLAADAAYVAMSATPLDALDDRTYRDAQLAAGAGRGAAAPRGIRAGRERVGDDLHRLRGAGAAG